MDTLTWNLLVRLIPASALVLATLAFTSGHIWHTMVWASVAVTVFSVFIAIAHRNERLPDPKTATYACELAARF